MCHAIIEVTWQGGAKESLRIDTPEQLEAKIDSLKSSVEALQFRVFESTGKYVRQTVWETQP